MNRDIPRNEYVPILAGYMMAHVIARNPNAKGAAKLSREYAEALADELGLKTNAEIDAARATERVHARGVTPQGEDLPGGSDR